jgi:hypothetical protein
MDPVLKRWLFEQWLGDRKDANELAKNHAYLLASFDHPDAVKQLVGEGNVHVSTDEEFEESSRMVREMNLKSLSNIKKKDKQGERKRKRRLIKE